MHRARALICAAALAPALPATAGPAPGAPPPAPAAGARSPASADRADRAGHSGDCARARALRRPCVLTLDPHEVDGGAPRGEGTALTARGWEPAGSLIRLRRDYLAEIVASVDAL